LTLLIGESDQSCAAQALDTVVGSEDPEATEVATSIDDRTVVGTDETTVEPTPIDDRTVVGRDDTTVVEKATEVAVSEA
jgi:hypothetical protein